MLEQKCNKLINTALKLFNLFETSHNNTFSNVFRTFNGGTFQSKYYVPFSKNKLITIKNVDDSGFNSSSVSYLSDAKADAKYKLNIGDIVLTMTGNIGRTGIVDEENCYLNQRVLKITSNSNLYLFCYLMKYQRVIIQLGKGTAQLNLSLEDLNKLEVKNSDSEILSFTKYDIIFDSLVNIKLQVKKLKIIKEHLLKKYF